MCHAHCALNVHKPVRLVGYRAMIRRGDTFELKTLELWKFRSMIALLIIG